MRLPHWMWRLSGVLPALLLAALLVFQAAGTPDPDQEARQRQDEALRLAESALRNEANHAHAYLSTQQQSVLTTLKQRLAEQVDGAHAIISAIYSTSSPVLPPNTLKALIRDSLRNIRFFEGRGYFFIDSMNGDVVLMPLHPQNEGRNLLENRDDQGTFIMKGLIHAAQQPGGSGYFSYRWYAPDSKERMVEKIAYVRYFAPYDWLIGAGEYVPAMERSIIDEATPGLSAVQFGPSGAIGLADPMGQMVLFPEISQNQRLPQDSFSITNGAAVQARILRKAHEGGGLVLFDWPHPDSGRQSKRAAWVERLNDGSVEWVVYASAHLSDFMPPAALPRLPVFLTPERLYGFAFLLLLAAVLVAWLWPVRHGS